MKHDVQKVVVALSGGVDSAVAAALLVEQGYDVTGVMLDLWKEPGILSDGSSAADDARRVADTLRIPFRVVNCAEIFKTRVVDAFIADYARGLTPNPCLTCNRTIKFGFLLETAQSLGADFLATGHYARIRECDGRYQLLQGVDRAKDQSYVLYMLEQSQLRHILLPLGERTKPQVREVAARLNLPVAQKAESQEICFVGDADYRRFLQTHAPGTVRPGPIFDTAGRELGRHQGLPFYTIGQRRGLAVSWSEPLYVLDIDVVRNALIVGPAAQLGRSELRICGVNYVDGTPPREPLPVSVKIRYKATGAAAMLCPETDTTVRIRLDAPLRDVTPGQGAVFYQGEAVVGGGIIVKEFSLASIHPQSDEP
ncbi:MAG: tRNA 2-thiouridine(34) synthase MnmA [Anaerolineae bacterium]|nr:tRNA 2-thiouridine(34) synthase MnmA [Anaerolineae bacterium]